jgi:hypothetical protein
MKLEDLHGAIARLAGSERLLVYDVPEAQAPERADPATPFVHGGEAWWSYVERRRAIDDGASLNLLVSLRGLRADERLLAVNWGAAYANAFLLVEPADPWLDLTTAEGVDDFAKRIGRDDADGLARAAYAEWVYWVRDETGALESREATLDLSDLNATLWQALWQRLPKTFAPADFLASLTLLNLREAELFTGGREVARAVVPFLTRLGLPVLYDARHVIQAMRQLVNAGLAWVQDPDDNWRLYRGPAEPIPDQITDERLALMLR